ncbi:sensor domain-containing diguanylate cyclase [Marinobacterium weihaiense]|uniref:diguanylate cyclase n=1 Tax=Marinobacterium weihaiense TaxID=2851016 RepID=A0ABS6MDK0_9GAMM|nr:diguanylate cyclase [Marinobacterium weihaiense]MBV0934387.1 diguanylate cyclase [Marinobacterium weihaiense]
MDLEQLLTFLPDALYVIDPETAKIVECNHLACESMGRTAEQLRTQTVLDLQDDVLCLSHWRSIADTIRKQQPYLFIGHHKRPDGSRFPVEVSTRVQWHRGRELFVSIVRDISSRVEKLTACCSDTLEHWQGLHDTADGCWSWQPQARTLYFSPNLKRMLGYGPDEMEPHLQTWTDSIHTEDAPLVLSVLKEHLKGTRHLYEAEYRLRNRNGHYLWVRDRGQVRERDAEGRPTRVVGMVHNITDLKLQEQDLQHKADFDLLTGLFNRRRGEVLAEQMIALMRRQNRPLGFALLDIDHFKRINDVYGHLSGDEVLRKVARFIADFVRTTDLVFRWGGEEFVLMCPDTSLSGMDILMQKLRVGVEYLRFSNEMSDLKVTMSIGVSGFPGDAGDMQTLMARADSALYSAKYSGRNQVVFYGGCKSACVG